MPEQRTLRVMIAERNPLVISALRDLIDRDERFVLIDGTQTGEGLIKALSGKQTFDVAIVGWKLLDMDAGQLLAEVQQRQINTRVVVFCNDHDVGIVKHCLRMGAQGFCYQFDDPGILFDTLLAVANGRICFPYVDISRIDETPVSRLTNRELEFLGMLADGWTNLQIATRTGISENTVKYHLKNLYDKIGVRNRAMAVALYVGEKKRLPQIAMQ
ncbi:LuxR C-terminal-related transcriptional regulator [Labrys okinawensis]|uniref:LuxR C-terminal-related transcriptional regulator n=1 Tax=Labrys okinawensis TaxID=346911 RepID=UPI0039BD02F3